MHIRAHRSAAVLCAALMATALTGCQTASSLIDADEGKTEGISPAPVATETVRTGKAAEAAPAAKVAADLRLLAGTWHEAVPGLPGRRQGFTLCADGTAESVGMATLRLERWSVRGDVLTLHGVSIGNAISFPFSEEYEILELGERTLRLRQGRLERTLERAAH